MNLVHLQTVNAAMAYASGYHSPAEAETLLGDPSLAKEDLGWVPQITLDEMVVADLEISKKYALLRFYGFKSAVILDSQKLIV